MILLLACTSSESPADTSSDTGETPDDGLCHGQGTLSIAPSGEEYWMSAIHRPDGAELEWTWYADETRSEIYERVQNTYEGDLLVRSSSGVRWTEWTYDADGNVTRVVSGDDSSFLRGSTYTWVDGLLVLTESFFGTEDGWAVNQDLVTAYEDRRPVSQVFSSGRSVATVSFTYTYEPPALDGVEVIDVGPDGTIDVRRWRTYDADGHLIQELSSGAATELTTNTWEGDTLVREEILGEDRMTREWEWAEHGLVDGWAISQELDGSILQSRHESWTWRCP